MNFKFRSLLNFNLKPSLIIIIILSNIIPIVYYYGYLQYNFISLNAINYDIYTFIKLSFQNLLFLFIYNIETGINNYCINKI
jgi:hypothetical protein